MKPGLLSEYQQRLDAALADASSVRKARFVLVEAGGTEVALPAGAFEAILPVIQPAHRYEVKHLACFCLHDGDEYVGLSLASLLQGKPVALRASSRVLVPVQESLDAAIRGVAFVVDALRGFAADLPDGTTSLEVNDLAQKLLKA